MFPHSSFFGSDVDERLSEFHEMIHEISRRKNTKDAKNWGKKSVSLAQREVPLNMQKNSFSNHDG